jgi:hypothetical protein
MWVSCFGAVRGTRAVVDARPAKLFDSHERRANVCIAREEVRAEVQREPCRV